VVRSYHRIIAASAALTAAVSLTAGSMLFSAGAATTPTQPGLFGSQDPTYDGVFRQSLALVAYDAAGSAPPAAAVTWLTSQQCADGGFQAFRPNVSTPCTPSDPVAYAGEDTNSTALAAVALTRLGRTTEAAKAVDWLEKARATDGGFPYFVGGSSDANSTADVLIALTTSGTPASSTNPARAFLESLQVGCDGAATSEDGAFAFQDYGTGLVANDAATVQVVVALSGSGLPVAPGTSSATAPRATCPVPVPAPPGAAAEDLGAGYVARLLDAYTGAVPQFDFSSGTRKPGSVSAGDTAWAVLALSATRLGSTQRDAALATVTKATGAAASDDPGLLALAALATHATGGTSSDVSAYVGRISATMRAGSSPSPTATSTATPAPTRSASATAPSSVVASASSTDPELPPTGGSPLTLWLAVLGALAVAAGGALVVATIGRGRHA
jgi:hypothetical protein